MNEQRAQILEELTRLSADIAKTSTDIEDASSLDEQIIIVETRSKPIQTQMEAAFSELRRLDLEVVRGKIQQSFAATGRGSKILKSAGHEATDMLDAAHDEASELRETAEQEAQELLNDAQRDANELIEEAIVDATTLLEEAEEEVEDLRN